MVYRQGAENKTIGGHHHDEDHRRKKGGRRKVGRDDRGKGCVHQNTVLLIFDWPFAIERGGSVTASESADLALLRTLAQEGLLEGWEETDEIITLEAQEAAS